MSQLGLQPCPALDTNYPIQFCLCVSCCVVLCLVVSCRVMPYVQNVDHNGDDGVTMADFY